MYYVGLSIVIFILFIILFSVNHIAESQNLTTTLINEVMYDPEEENTEYTGEIRIVNNEDNSDYEIITVTLATPRNKAIMKPFFNFLENYPILYQLFQRFIGI